MPATATYRIGPSDFFLPGDLAADAATVDGQITELDELLDDAGAPAEFADQWLYFHNAWSGFYSDHFGGFFSNLVSALNNSNRDDLIRYENQLAAFQAQARTFGAEQVAPVAPSTGTKDTLGDHLNAQGLPSAVSLTVLLVAVALLIVLWKASK